MKYPYLKFYFRDWQANTELQSCSIAARGVWIELMCIMAQSERFGYLERNGEPLSTETLARLIRVFPACMAETLAELEAAGVFSRDPDTGAIYSRRMVRDNSDAELFLTAGRKGGNPALKSNALRDTIPIPIPIPIPTKRLTPPVNPPVNPRVNPTLNPLVNQKQPKQPHGEFGKVTLTDDEFAKLQTAYGPLLQTAIEMLDAYMASKGKKYASCYAVMKKNGWVWEKSHTANQPRNAFGRPVDPSEFAPDLGKEERDRDEYNRKRLETMERMRPGTLAVKPC